MDINESIMNERNIYGFMLTNGFFDGSDKFKTSEDVKVCIQELSTVSSLASLFDTKIFSGHKELNEMMISKLSGKNEDNQNPPCPRCGGERQFLRVQRRSADEAAENELHCLSCGLVQKC